MSVKCKQAMLIEIDVVHDKLLAANQPPEPQAACFIHI